ncbi:hypothetical protein DKX38_015987 [Salix brachista]|uniref:X8 domain-containing protein n=1 Tax=Salix brachista TaxID=2182728 RepID=A0A5N5L6S6_9ROSI|nr:hypothetical protein DKX38_015987 [Salix brachista]
MAVLVFLVLFLALTGHSSNFAGFSSSAVGATYCICKDGVGDAQLQKSLDYACGAGADCAQVLQNGPCYQPNTIKDHCSYAVNSYFQKKGQATGSCDFSGTATTSATPPQNVASGCSYPASATSSEMHPFLQIIFLQSLVSSFSGISFCFYSTGTSTTPTGTGTGTTPTGTGTGTTPTGTSTGTSTGTGTGTGSITGTPSSIIPTPPSSVFNSGLGPTGFNDNSDAPFKGANLWFIASMTLLFSGMLLLWG